MEKVNRFKPSSLPPIHLDGIDFKLIYISQIGYRPLLIQNLFLFFQVKEASKKGMAIYRLRNDTLHHFFKSPIFVINFQASNLL